MVEVLALLVNPLSVTETRCPHGSHISDGRKVGTDTETETKTRTVNGQTLNR